MVESLLTPAERALFPRCFAPGADREVDDAPAYVPPPRRNPREFRFSTKPAAKRIIAPPSEPLPKPATKTCRGCPGMVVRPPGISEGVWTGMVYCSPDCRRQDRNRRLREDRPARDTRGIAVIGPDGTRYANQCAAAAALGCSRKKVMGLVADPASGWRVA